MLKAMSFAHSFAPQDVYHGRFAGDPEIICGTGMYGMKEGNSTICADSNVALTSNARLPRES